MIERKGSSFNLSVDSYHFKIELKTHRGGFEECYPNMNLQVSMLDSRELKLEKKKFQDSP